MYQLAPEGPLDRTRLFVESCTSMVPSSENLSLVGSVAKMMRDALFGADLKPLRDFTARTQEWCTDIDDVFAAAGEAVVDELGDVPHAQLHDIVRRVAQIERDVLSSLSFADRRRPAYVS